MTTVLSISEESRPILLGKNPGLDEILRQAQDDSSMVTKVHFVQDDNAVGQKFSNFRKLSKK